MNSTLIVIILYLIIVFTFALFIHGARNRKEYALSKNTLSLTVFALVMTMFGAGFILGGAELGYNYGWFGLAYGLSAALGLFGLALFSKRIYLKVKEEKVSTVSSFLFKKFKDEKIKFLSAILSIIALTAIASAQFFSAIKIFEVVGMPPTFSLIFLGLIVIVIAIKGIGALSKFGIYNVCIATLGGLSAIFIASTSGTQMLNPVRFSVLPISSLFWLILPTILYTLIGQDLHQKVYSAKSWKVARNAGIISGIALILLSFFPVIVGMQSRNLFDIAAYDAMPRFIEFAVPSLFKGLFIAAILAAVIGSSQSVTNAAATQISEDLFVWKNASRKIRNNIPKFGAIFIALIALIVAIYSGSIINNIIVAYIIYTCGMFMPMSIAFFYKSPEKIAGPVLAISVISIILTSIAEFTKINFGMPTLILTIGGSFLAIMIVVAIRKYKFINQKV